MVKKNKQTKKKPGAKRPGTNGKQNHDCVIQVGSTVKTAI